MVESDKEEDHEDHDDAKSVVSNVSSSTAKPATKSKNKKGKFLNVSWFIWHTTCFGVRMDIHVYTYYCNTMQFLMNWKQQLMLHCHCSNWAFSLKCTHISNYLLDTHANMKFNHNIDILSSFNMLLNITVLF